MGTDLNDPLAPMPEPVVVTMIGSNVRTGSGTGDGNVIQTPHGMPNLILKAVGPMQVVVIRAGKAFFDSLLGLMAVAGITTTLLPPGDFAFQLKVCAGLSVGAAAVSVLRNIAEIFTKLDQKNPTLGV